MSEINTTELEAIKGLLNEALERFVKLMAITATPEAPPLSDDTEKYSVTTNRRRIQVALDKLENGVDQNISFRVLEAEEGTSIKADWCDQPGGIEGLAVKAGQLVSFLGKARPHGYDNTYRFLDVQAVQGNCTIDNVVIAPVSEATPSPKPEPAEPADSVAVPEPQPIEAAKPSTKMKFPFMCWNMSGAGHAESVVPGKNWTNYHAPRSEDLAMFPANTCFRVAGTSSRFELQQNDGKVGVKVTLDETYCKLFDVIFNTASERGQKILLDATHDYGRRSKSGPIIGSPEYPLQAYINLLIAIYNRFKHHKSLWALSLMNEPHDMGNYPWWPTADKAVKALREAGCTHTIAVPGNDYTGAEGWEKRNTPGFPLRHEDGRIRTDVIYDAHTYLDLRKEGLYRQEDPSISENDPMYIGLSRGVKMRKTREIADPQVLVKRLLDIASARKKYGVDFLVGETGIPHHEWGLTTEQNNAFATALKNGLDFALENNIPVFPFSVGPGHSKNAVNGIQCNGILRFPYSEVYKQYESKQVEIGA